METPTKEVYLMNPATGSVDTLAAWISDMEASAPDYEMWGGSREAGVEMINGLCEVQKSEDGPWEEVPTLKTIFKGPSK